MLARLEAAASTRVRSAARPDALMFIALKKSIGSPLAVRDGAEDLELLAHCTRRGAVLDCVLRELHQGVVGVDAVAVETGSPLALGDEGIDGRQRLARLDALRRVHGLPEVEVLGRVAWSVGVGDVACEQVLPLQAHIEGALQRADGRVEELHALGLMRTPCREVARLQSSRVSGLQLFVERGM